MTKSLRSLGPLLLTLVVLVSPRPSAAQASRPGVAQAPDGADLAGGWHATVGVGTSEEKSAVLLVNEGGTAHIQVIDGDNADGVWIKTGPRQFALTLDEFDDVDLDGVPDQRYRIRSTVQLSNRNALAGTITVDQMSLDGTVVLETEGHFPVEGTRMQVVPE